MKVTVGIPTYNRASLLEQTIRSALAQSHADFRLLICDNGSDDETPAVVASFDDPRIEYVRSEANVGMIPNFNRVIELARGDDALVMLSDDDVLYPEYLASVVETLASHANVGVVHTAIDLIDEASHIIERNVALLPPEAEVTLEPGEQYLQRSMRSHWTVAWSSALFRIEALAAAGGLRLDEHPSADVPLLMRIALKWDLAMLAKPLVGVRVHTDAATAAIAGWTGTGYALGTYAENLLERRLRFLDEAQLPSSKVTSYRAAARHAYRQDVVARTALRGGSDLSWSATTHALLELLRREPRALGMPSTWRLIGAQLGGRHLKRALHRR
jgi:hypothetical protein